MKDLSYKHPDFDLIIHRIDRLWYYYITEAETCGISNLLGRGLPSEEEAIEEGIATIIETKSRRIYIRHLFSSASPRSA